MLAARQQVANSFFIPFPPVSSFLKNEARCPAPESFGRKMSAGQAAIPGRYYALRAGKSHAPTPVRMNIPPDGGSLRRHPDAMCARLHGLLFGCVDPSPQNRLRQS
jgi:hypothetical protein